MHAKLKTKYNKFFRSWKLNSWNSEVIYSSEKDVGLEARWCDRVPCVTGRNGICCAELHLAYFCEFLFWQIKLCVGAIDWVQFTVHNVWRWTKSQHAQCFCQKKQLFRNLGLQATIPGRRSDSVEILNKGFCLEISSFCQNCWKVNRLYLSGVRSLSFLPFLPFLPLLPFFFFFLPDFPFLPFFLPLSLSTAWNEKKKKKKNALFLPFGHRDQTSQWQEGFHMRGKTRKDGWHVLCEKYHFEVSEFRSHQLVHVSANFSLHFNPLLFFDELRVVLLTEVLSFIPRQPNSWKLRSFFFFFFPPLFPLLIVQVYQFVLFQCPPTRAKIQTIFFFHGFTVNSPLYVSVPSFMAGTNDDFVIFQPSSSSWNRQKYQIPQGSFLCEPVCFLFLVCRPKKCILVTQKVFLFVLTSSSPFLAFFPFLSFFSFFADLSFFFFFFFFPDSLPSSWKTRKLRDLFGGKFNSDQEIVLQNQASFLWSRTHNIRHKYMCFIKNLSSQG